jgi:thiamine-phosphate pyrophosphorylase
VEEWRDLLLAQVRGAVTGGVNVVQVRENGIEARDYLSFLRDCVALARGTACRVVVNDRVDLAILADAAGVHLRESSLPIEAVRRLSHGEFLVGRSVHAPATAERARNADYLIAGSVFETASKPGLRAPLGLEGLRSVVDAAGKCPVWAIGGITPDRVSAVVACGAQGIAAIGAFFPDGHARDLEQDVRERAEALRFSLDRCR